MFRTLYQRMTLTVVRFEFTSREAVYRGHPTCSLLPEDSHRIVTLFGLQLSDCDCQASASMALLPMHAKFRASTSNL